MTHSSPELLLHSPTTAAVPTCDVDLLISAKTDAVSAQALRQVRLCDPAWTAAHQAPLSMGFSRQEHWSGLPFPPSGNLPGPGILRLLRWQTDPLPLAAFLVKLYFPQNPTGSKEFPQRKSQVSVQLTPCVPAFFQGHHSFLVLPVFDCSSKLSCNPS